MGWTTFLLAASVKATVIFAAAFLIALALARASAASRYLVWSAALAIALVIPLLSPWVRPWNVPVVSTSAPMTAIVAPQPTAPSEQPAPTLPTSWLIPAWLSGVALVLVRVAAGHCRIAFWLRRTEAIRDPEWTALLAEAGSRIGLSRPIHLRRSREADTPLTYGLFHPFVVLPAESAEWSADRRRVVLLHELAHARRLDPLAYLIAQVSCAAYWFHPLAWLALSRFRTEQERSCDDAVVIAGTARSSYAEHLVSLAKSVTLTHRSWPAALSMAGERDLEQRVHSLLDPFKNRRAPSGRVCIAAISAILAAAIPFAALRAQDSSTLSALSGSVLDASGASVPHAAVLLRSADGAHQEMSTSGEDGVYRFSRVAAGRYTIEVKARGFAPYQQSGVTLNSGASERLDIRLALGGVTETVEVVGKGPRPPAAVTPQRIRVGGNVQATKLIYSAKPAYPADAEAAGVEGTVVLRAVISIQGNLLGLAVMNSSIDPRLAQAALDAVQQWRYEPTLLNGAPVEVVTTIAVNFRLQP
jgi:TonB family protein